MKVKDVMTRDPLRIDQDAPLGTAVEVMRSKQVRHLPVVDEGGVLVGVVTDRDLRQAVLAPTIAEHLSLRAQRRLRGVAEALEDLRVRDVMTWGVVTTHPEATLSHAALLMFEKRVGSLPVVRDGRLVGILTERDLTRALVEGFPAVHYDPEGFLW